MRKSLITIILSFAFIAVLFLFDWPIYNEFNFLRSEVKRYKTILEEKQELTTRVNQLKQIYKDREDEFKKVGYALPSDKDVPGLIVQFEALSAENGLVLEDLNFVEQTVAKTRSAEGGAEIKTQGAYKKLSVSLSLSGSYQSFNSFLKALESNVRLMDIKSISFSSGEEDASIFNFKINLEVYYQ